MTRTERPRRPLAMDEQITRSSLHEMPFDLARVVRDVEQETQVAIWKKVAEHPPCIMPEDFTVGECAVDRGSHSAKIALAHVRMTRCTGEFAIRKLDPGSLRRNHHFLQEFRSDLVAKPPRTAMNRDDDGVQREPEGLSGDRIEDVGDRLDLKIVITGTERPHFPALPFLGAFGDMLGPRALHLAVFLDALQVPRLSQTLLEAQRAPPRSIASMAAASSVIAPLLPTPAGIWRDNESASDVCMGVMSATDRPVSIVRTPQEMSNPTPPAETTPP